MVIKIELDGEDEDGEFTEEVSLPAKYEVCPRCAGSGVHDHPAFSSGITSSEWAEWGAEDQESYMQGAYDVQCSECDGQRVVLVVDEDKCPAGLLARYEKHQSRQAAYAREREAEIRYGY